MLRLLIVVSIAMNILKGSADYTDVIKKLNEAIGIYTSAMTDLSVSLGITLIEQVKELHDQIRDLSSSVEDGLQNIEVPMRAIAGYLLKSQPDI